MGDIGAGVFGRELANTIQSGLRAGLHADLNADLRTVPRASLSAGLRPVKDHLRIEPLQLTHQLRQPVLVGQLLERFPRGVLPQGVRGRDRLLFPLGEHSQERAVVNDRDHALHLADQVGIDRSQTCAIGPWAHDTCV